MYKIQIAEKKKMVVNGLEFPNFSSILCKNLYFFQYFVENLLIFFLTGKCTPIFSSRCGKYVKCNKKMKQTSKEKLLVFLDNTIAAPPTP